MKKKKKCPPPAPTWLTSWSDLVTLLLTFFILMFSTADIDGKDFFLILSSFRGSLGMFEGGHTLSKGRLEEMGLNINTLPSEAKKRSLAQRLKKALEAFKPEIQSKKVRIREDERGLIISLASDAYFDPGSAALKEEIRPVLSKVTAIMGSIPNFTRIEGHTDSNPISPGTTEARYETNWELSSARSVNIIRYLTEVENVEPRKLSAVGFAEYRPVDNNNTPEGRAFNRRVDIVILRDQVYTESSKPGIERPLPGEEWR
ncbi:MAG: OmpA family protein [Spirochaetes bacterium]|jgi:chemotaxis protein MotB|nr:OmpA family protein [Spirochaetota bacterium]